MGKNKHALIILENNWIPVDRRVLYEATALTKNGWNVSVICPMPEKVFHDEFNDFSPNHKQLYGINIYSFPLAFAEKGIASYVHEYFVAFTSISRLSWTVWRKARFDVVHICNPPDFLFPIGLLYRFFGVKFIFDHHDLFPEMVIWRFKGKVRKIFYLIALLFEKLTILFANHVITTNESYKEIEIDRDRKDKDKITVIRNGPRISDFLPSKYDKKLKGSFNHVICYVGVMGEDDGIIGISEIMDYIVHKYRIDDVLFLLIGDGSTRAELENRINILGLKNQVLMPGMVKDDKVLRKYMSMADIFISPEPWSPLNEKSTFIKIGEYMAIGRPIVAFDLKESRYTAHDAAVYIEPGNYNEFARQIVKLLANPKRRLEMGRLGRKRIKTVFGWEYQEEKLIALYSKIS